MRVNNVTTLVLFQMRRFQIVEGGSSKRGKTPGEQVQHYQTQQSKTADSRHFPAGDGAKLNSFGERRPGFCPGYWAAPI